MCGTRGVSRDFHKILKFVQEIWGGGLCSKKVREFDLELELLCSRQSWCHNRSPKHKRNGFPFLKGHSQGVPGGALGGTKDVEILEVEEEVVESNAERRIPDKDESEGSDGSDGNGVGGLGDGSGGDENAWVTGREVSEMTEAVFKLIIDGTDLWEEGQ